MNYQQHTHCPDCFKSSSSAICPHCQFNRDEYLQKEAALYYLPLFTTLGNDYVLGRVLGEGSFAIVYAALRIEDGLALAVKEYYPQDLAKRGLDGKTVNPKSDKDFLDWHNRFIAEGELLRSCYDYPPIKSGVVRYAGLIREQNKTTYLLMERLYGEPLGNYLKPDKENPYGKIMSTNVICGWLKPLLETLHVLHGKKIYHRDISANNIFLCGADLPGFKNLEGLKATPVLMDFGLARVGARGTVHSGTTLGTGTFIAPEQLSGGRCDQRTDLYSLGAVIYLCLHGHAPPSVEDRRQGAAFSRLLQTDDVSVALHKVALACLQLEIDKRPADVAQLLKYLQSCWLNQTKEKKPPEKITPAPVISQPKNQNTIIQGFQEGTKIEMDRKPAKEVERKLESPELPWFKKLFVLSSEESPKIAIGENYQGGIIFYIDRSGKYGLIAAPFDQNDGKRIQWYNGSHIEIGKTSTKIGTGKANTEAIIRSQGKGNYAAKLCADLVLDGYDDWYLPSKDELNLMYTNIGQGASGALKNRGGFASYRYWSSSEYDVGLAWGQYFSNGNQVDANKGTTLYVRAVRAF